MKDFLKSIENGKEPIKYDNKLLLQAILSIVAHNKVCIDHIIDELYPNKKKNKKITEQLNADGVKLYWKYLAVIASGTKDA